MRAQPAVPTAVPTAATARVRPTPDEGVLKALQALVDEQTRFLGQSVQADDERSAPQAWTSQETVRLTTGVQTRDIFGDFRPNASDVKAASPNVSVAQDLDSGLALGMGRMQRLLANPEHTFDQVANSAHGTYLAMRDHWVLNTCNTCSGAGKKTCYRCHGQGSETCSSCSGRRTVACGCLGGKTTCTRCGGTCSVMVTHLVTVNVYNPNTGVNDSRSSTEYRNEPCPACVFGQVTCSRCGGSATRTCSTCNGQGQCTCPVCSGQRYLRCNPCHATGKTGTAAHVVVTASHTPALTWDPGSESWATEVGRSVGLTTVVALSERLRSSAPVLEGDDTFRLVRQGVLPADQAQVRCGGATFDAIAYGAPRRWWKGPEIVEHLLQRDVRALAAATGEARTSRWSVRTGGVVEALSNVAQSPAHTAIVAQTLNGDTAAPEGVSAAYVKTVQDAVRAGTLLVHRALGLDWAIKVLVVMAVVGGASWLVLGTLGASLVSAGIAALGVVLRHPVALRRLKGVYGSTDAARAAQRLAGHDHGRSWGLAGAATLAMATLMGTALPARGPWQPEALRMPPLHLASTGHSSSGETPDAPAITTVAQALDARVHGRLRDARGALEGMVAQNTPGAAGVLAWMTLQGEGQVGFAEGSPPQGMGDRSIRAWDAARLVARSGGNAWGDATQGMLLLTGSGGALRNERQGLAYLQKAAEHGATPAMVQMGRVALQQHHPEQAQRWFTAAANAGDPQGMFDLGTLLWNQSSGRDSLTPHSWWNRAERQGGVMVHEPVWGLPAVTRR